MSNFAARIHVLLARDAPLGVVIRRGPSKQVATIGWNRDSDQFTLGQWLKGRIYERRCDLSPDGKHLIYFDMNGKWDSETKGSWAAISRAPYLKAIGLWANGSGWHGGGLFTDDNSYWLNEGYNFNFHTEITSVGLKRVETQPFGAYGGECLGVYFPRLLHGGWKLVNEPAPNKNAEADRWVFDKAISHGWTLRKYAIVTLKHPPGKGCYYDTHELIRDNDGKRIDGEKWEWADVDRHRVVWSEAGRLFAAHLTTDGLEIPDELYDFNHLAFEAREAPY